MIRNILAGLRLAFCLRCGLNHFRVSLWHLWVVLLLYALAQCGADFFTALPPRRFNPQAIPHVCLTFGALFLACSLIGMGLRRARMPLALPVILFSALIVPSMLGHLLAWQPYPEWLSYKRARHLRHLLLIWYFLIFFRALLLVSGTEALRQLLGALLLLACYAGPARYMYIAPFWLHDYRQEDEAEQHRPALYPEDVLQGQDALLNAQLAAIAPRHAGRNTYVILFGGYADENVFLKEVTFGRKVLEEKYHARGHILSLVNNEESLKRTPMATVTNLKNALLALGHKADLSQDMLLLYLTSHGSPEGELSVEMQDIWLRQLDGKRLKALLTESGFNWKTVIVSSCYSGMFIDPLKDDYTLVMTASRKDLTSFGCGNESDMTYFGDALFRQALPRTTDLAEAFALAKAYIFKREEEDDLDHHSEPQISIGRSIGEYLQGKNPPLPERLGPPAPAGVPLNAAIKR